MSEAPEASEKADVPLAAETDALAAETDAAAAIAKSDVSVTVDVGTSALATEDFCSRVAAMVNIAYGYGRVSANEVAQRLSMGDAGEHANRVLHVATRDGELVGCCSSTIQTPWCPSGCGHWGLLVVDVEAQGTGVASALVAAAEGRLLEAGLRQVQMEYEYTPGDPFSERLYKWYEGSCGFSGGSPPSSSGRTQFRRCRKRLDASKLGSAGKSPGAASSSARRSAAGEDAVAPAGSVWTGCGAVLMRLMRTVSRRLTGGGARR